MVSPQILMIFGMTKTTINVAGLKSKPILVPLEFWTGVSKRASGTTIGASVGILVAETKAIVKKDLVAQELSQSFCYTFCKSGRPNKIFLDVPCTSIDLTKVCWW